MTWTRWARVVAATVHQARAGVAARFSGSVSVVAKWYRVAWQTGSPGARSHTCARCPKVDSALGGVLRRLVAARNDLTPVEAITISDARRYFHRCGYAVH